MFMWCRLSAPDQSGHFLNRILFLINTRIRVDGALIGFEKDAVSVIHWFRVDRRLIREKKYAVLKISGFVEDGA